MVKKILILLIGITLLFPIHTTSEITSSNGNSWAINLIKGNEAHLLTSGEDVVLALLDTGISSSVFPNGLWINSNEIPNNNIDDDNNGYIDDYNGWNFHSDNNDTSDWSTISHGTSVASIIYEIAPSVKIMIIKVITFDNIITDLNNLNEGLIYAKNNGAKVIYMPFKISSVPKYLTDTFSDLYTNDITLVASAGQNTQLGPLDYIFYPGKLSTVIASGAIDINQNVYPKSNYGPQLELTAPGVDLKSFDKNGDEIDVTGTSFSGGYVAGTIALMYNRKSEITPNEVRNILYSTGTDINTSGIDSFTGSGILRSDLATNYAIDSDPPVLINEEFLPDYSNPVSFTINLQFYEISGIIDCNYYYNTSSHDWTENTNCANFENRLYSINDQINLEIVIEEQASKISLVLNLTDFSGKKLDYYKESIYTGFSDPVTTDSYVSNTSIYSSNPSESTTLNSKSPLISSQISHTENHNANTGKLKTDFFIILLPIPTLFIIRKRKK